MLTITEQSAHLDAGGFAFSCTSPGIAGAVTLRDYFAVRALIPLLQDVQDAQTYDGAVEAAYVIADLMLEVRERKDPLQR